MSASKLPEDAAMLIRLDATVHGPNGLTATVAELRAAVAELKNFRAQILGACLFCGFVAPLLWHYLLR